MRAADHLVQTLKSLGTKYIFSLSGNQIMPIYDALIGSGIELIHVRHEGAAVHMADAWGRLTGTPGVALLAAGPGFINSLSATYVAKMAESPVIVLSGRSPLATQGQGDFQEIDQADMAAAVSKASWQVADKNRFSHDLEKAFFIAQDGRPGPVHLALPFDLLSAEVEPAHIQPFAPPLGKIPAPEMIGRIASALQQSQRPLILAGPALLRADVFRHAQTAGYPIIGMESPRGVFDPSLGTFATTLKQADLLILLGKKLDFTLKLGQEPFIKAGTKIIQIDADAAVLERTKQNGGALELVSLIQADPENVLNLLIPALSEPGADKARWMSEVTQSLAHTPPAWNDLISKSGEPLFSAEVGAIINDYLAGGENSVLISDGGEFGQWMQALIRPPHRVINGLSGSIGNAVPFVLAARLAFPNSRIVACTGDGSLGFHPFEFDTAVRHSIPFITVIGNDARWNAEYQIQLRDYGADRIDSVDLRHTAYDQVVSALGGWGCSVTDADGLQEALTAAEASKQPAAINVSIQGEAAPKLS